MYKIHEELHDQPYTLLLPAILDANYPLLKYAFFSRRYYPVVMDAYENIATTGLKYVNNDMCFPIMQIVGQIIETLKSGKYNLYKTVILEAQAGDACRGSNYIPVMRKALDNAGFSMVPIISLNVKNLENGHRLPLSLGMVFRAVAAVIYTDLLMILKNQIRPYENNSGDTENLYNHWIQTLSIDIKNGINLHFHQIKKTMRIITEEFKKIPITKRTIPKIGIVGELYAKYCHLGNGNLENYLKQLDCEYYINGLSWYALYYMDSHRTGEDLFAQTGYTLALTLFSKIHAQMVSALKDHGFYCMDSFKQFKQNAYGLISFRCAIGDGWLIGAEICNHTKNGYSKVLCCQPFGCLPNQVCGKGIYTYLQRKLPKCQLVSIDFDGTTTDVNIRNRIQLLLEL